VELSRNTALPGEVVTVTFSSRDRGVVITSCNARFSDRAAVACRPGETSVRLPVPNDAPAGANSVNWTLSYKEGTAGAARKRRREALAYRAGFDPLARSSQSFQHVRHRATGRRAARRARHHFGISQTPASRADGRRARPSASRSISARDRSCGARASSDRPGRRTGG
jgi:hypothetical protein